MSLDTIASAESAPRAATIDVDATVERLAPLVLEHAEAIERDRTLPTPLVEALYEAGVFSTMVPRELGGLEVDPLTLLHLVEELSRLDASVGWAAMIGSGAGSAFMRPEAFHGLIARTGGRFISSASFGRIAGKAVRVDGGYRISGRWPFASISPFATWCGALSVLHDDDGNPVIHPKDNMPWTINALWPATDAVLHDTWDGLGLRGTGSGDMEVDELFVPTEQVDELGFRAIAYDRPLYRLREMPVVPHSAHAIGIAVKAQEAFFEQTRVRAARGSIRQALLGQQQAHQIGMARADALIRASRSFQNDVVSRAYAWVHDHPTLSMELRVEMREAMIFAVRSCREAVDILFQMAGSSAVLRGRPLERAHADVYTAANHITCAETEYAAPGSYWLTRDLPGGEQINGRPFF